jgi:hypothetical protein
MKHIDWMGPTKYHIGEKANNVDDDISFRICIRMVGKILYLDDVKPSDLMISIKQKITEKEGQRTDGFRLVRHCELLEDYMLVSDYNLEANSRIFLMKPIIFFQEGTEVLNKLFMYQYGRTWLFE